MSEADRPVVNPVLAQVERRRLFRSALADLRAAKMDETVSLLESALTDDDRIAVSRLIRLRGIDARMSDWLEYAARLVETYDPDRPCRWAPLCVLPGEVPVRSSM